MYTEVFRYILVPVFVAVLSSGAFTAIVNKILSRKSDVSTLSKSCSELIKNCDRQAEGLSVVMESLEILLEAMHEKGLVNGESEHVRQSINNYLMTCTERGLYMSQKKGKNE